MHYKETLTEAKATLRDLFTGLQAGTTAAPGLSKTHGCYILGYTIYINILYYCLIKQLTKRANDDKSNTNTPIMPSPLVANELPILRPAQNLTLNQNLTSPKPMVWQFVHNPEGWIYIYGSLKTEKP